MPSGLSDPAAVARVLGLFGLPLQVHLQVGPRAAPAQLPSDAAILAISETATPLPVRVAVARTSLLNAEALRRLATCAVRLATGLARLVAPTALANGPTTPLADASVELADGAAPAIVPNTRTLAAD